MRKITSNGSNREYHQCNLDGDLPINQGPSKTQEIRIVRLTGAGGHIGSYDFCSLQEVYFDELGRPVHIQDYSLSAGTADTKIMIKQGDNADEKDIKTIRDRLAKAWEATQKPIIDLTDF